MVISSINCSYRTYEYTYVTRRPLLTRVVGEVQASTYKRRPRLLQKRAKLRAHFGALRIDKSYGTSMGRGNAYVDDCEE